jgi:predicted acyl esterase
VKPSGACKISARRVLSLGNRLHLQLSDTSGKLSIGFNSVWLKLAGLTVGCGTNTSPLPDYGLIYRGEPLDADLTIAGAVRVTLHVESDCPDTDFVAKLIEVTPEGRAMLWRQPAGPDAVQ